MDRAAIRQLLADNGLTFRDVADACGDGKHPYAVEALRQYGLSDEIEFDPNPVVSESPSGAFVQAWVWVSSPCTGESF